MHLLTWPVRAVRWFFHSLTNDASAPGLIFLAFMDYFFFNLFFGPNTLWKSSPGALKPLVIVALVILTACQLLAHYRAYQNRRATSELSQLLESMLQLTQDHVTFWHWHTDKAFDVLQHVTGWTLLEIYDDSVVEQRTSYYPDTACIVKHWEISIEHDYATYALVVGALELMEDDPEDPDQPITFTEFKPVVPDVQYALKMKHLSVPTSEIWDLIAELRYSFLQSAIQHHA